MDNISPKLKVCASCGKSFKASSRHLVCPACRDGVKKKPCIDCGAPVFKRSTRCPECYKIHVTGIPTPLDKYTGFREFIRRAKKRNKLGDLTLQDLLEQWEKQKGICPYSGVLLILPSYKHKNDPIFTASLDRVDSKLPYSKTNIQYVSVAMNYMKGQLTNDETVVLCKLISYNWGNIIA